MQIVLLRFKTHYTVIFSFITKLETLKSHISFVLYRSPSPSSSILIRATLDASLFPDDLKCRICSEIFRDPRTLNCLHSFCFQCLVDENFKQDSSIPFWSQPGAEDHDWKGEWIKIF